MSGRCLKMPQVPQLRDRCSLVLYTIVMNALYRVFSQTVFFQVFRSIFDQKCAIFSFSGPSRDEKWGQGVEKFEFPRLFVSKNVGKQVAKPKLT